MFMCETLNTIEIR